MYFMRVKRKKLKNLDILSKIIRLRPEKRPLYGKELPTREFLLRLRIVRHGLKDSCRWVQVDGGSISIADLITIMCGL